MFEWEGKPPRICLNCEVKAEFRVKFVISSERLVHAFVDEIVPMIYIVRM